MYDMTGYCYEECEYDSSCSASYEAAAFCPRQMQVVEVCRPSGAVYLCVWCCIYAYHEVRPRTGQLAEHCTFDVLVCCCEIAAQIQVLEMSKDVLFDWMVWI
jgi:hypothetical protein